MWSDSAAHVQCWKHSWAFWLLPVLQDECMALGNKCFAQTCVHLLICDLLLSVGAHSQWERSENYIWGIQQSAGINRNWRWWFIFFLIYTVFVQSLNFLSLTALCEQMLDLLTKDAGDAQLCPLWSYLSLKKMNVPYNKRQTKKNTTIAKKKGKYFFFSLL